MLWGLEVLLSVFLVLIFCFLSIHSETVLVQKEKSFLKILKYSRIDERTKDISLGMVTMNEEMLDKELIKGDKRILLSDFGEVEYFCSGTCHCETGRRTIGSITARSVLSYLVASVSASVAYRNAKDYFTEECQIEMSESCEDSTSIRSEVDYCSEMLSSFEDEDKSDLIKDKFETKDYGQDIRVYSCFGRCLTKKGLRTEQTKRLAEEFDCDKLRVADEVVIDVTDLNYDHLNVWAKKLFIKEALTPFCKENGKKKYRYVRKSKNGEGIRSSEWKNVFLCIGGDHGNDSVKCRQVYPGFTPHNKWRYRMSIWKRRKRLKKRKEKNREGEEGDNNDDDDEEEEFTYPEHFRT